MKSQTNNSKVKFVDPSTFTPHFNWRKNPQNGAKGKQLFCEDVSLGDVAQEFGTPAYVYSRTAIAEAFGELDRGLAPVPHTICFAMKANGNLSILKFLAKLGSGFDIVSGGELEHLARIGVPGDRIVFSGVGKTREEIRFALEYRGATGRSGARGAREERVASGRSDARRPGILLFNVESEPELAVLQEEAARQVARGGQPPAVSIRVNPDVLAGGHPNIATGRHDHKFGIDWTAARKLYLAHRNSKAIRWQGISAHIGSQIVTPRPFKEALKRVVGFVRELRKEGIDLRYLDFGGGLGIRYTHEALPSRTAYARMIAAMVRPLGIHLLLEPGRTIIAPGGVLLTRVLYRKENRGKTFVVVDAGMTDLVRPALYGAVHPITRTTTNGADSRSSQQRVDVVGPVCETSDCFLRNWPLGPVEPGDVLAIWATGAYGMSLASNYNGRCRGPEILVQGKKREMIRRRETQKDLLRADILA